MSPGHINGKILGYKVHFLLQLCQGKGEGRFIISAELGNRDGLKMSKVFCKKFYNMLNISFNCVGFFWFCFCVCVVWFFFKLNK